MVARRYPALLTTRRRVLWLTSRAIYTGVVIAVAAPFLGTLWAPLIMGLYVVYMWLVLVRMRRRPCIYCGSLHMVTPVVSPAGRLAEPMGLWDVRIPDRGIYEFVCVDHLLMYLDLYGSP